MVRLARRITYSSLNCFTLLLFRRGIEIIDSKAELHFDDVISLMQ